MGGLPGHLEPMAQLVGHAVAVVKDLFDRLGLEFFGVTLTAHTGSYWTGNRRLSTVYKTLGDSDTFYVRAIKGVSRIYQQTFVDTYSK